MDGFIAGVLALTFCLFLVASGFFWGMQAAKRECNIYGAFVTFGDAYTCEKRPRAKSP